VRFIAVVNYAPNVWKAELHPAGQGVEDYDTHFAMARQPVGGSTHCRRNDNESGRVGRGRRFGLRLLIRFAARPLCQTLGDAHN